MKKLVLILGVYIVFTTCAIAQESSLPAGMMNPTEEINSSFAQSKNTSWFVHRMKPKSNIKNITKTEKKQEDKKSLLNKFNNDDKLIKQINDDNANNAEQDFGITRVNVDTSKLPTDIKQEPKPAEPIVNKKAIKEKKKEGTKTERSKESVHTVQPAEKTINAEDKQAEKIEKQNLEQEKTKEQYRELQALTQQYQQAVALYTDNNLDESLEVFSQIPEDKRPAEAWLLMGNILMDKEKKDEAVFMYGRAIITDSKFYKAYYNLGNVYLADDKLNMAVEQYKMASKYAPSSPYVFYNLGCAYLKLGELKKAKSAFIRAVELNNTVADFHYNLAYVYKKLGKEKMAKTYLDNYNKLTGQID